ncbi:FAD-dependent oxidoreductase [Paenibacillus albiflavus]|uniref:FAD-dependent oxidoreductase n=2 Tax=Paenibacillus albiflavus TaxID=2545760 RepID=A0A4R4ED10_9BACL|nr:FAD-dependent oxidoreductase [Paenibacillus albiflavus]
MEGLYMARAAADEGLSVKIIDTRKEFGGQLLQGQMFFLDEAKDGSGTSLLQGRVKELFTGFKGGSIRKLPEFENYVQTKLVGTIPVASGIQIEQIDTVTETSGLETVKAITYSVNGSSKIIQADYFVENTDHAALSSRLKATPLPSSNSFYGGKELEFMAAGLMMKFKNVDWAKFNKEFNGLSAADKTKNYGGGYVNESFALGLTGMTNRFKTSNDRVFLRGLNALNQGGGQVAINALLVYKVDPSDPESIKEAVELGSKELPGILEHFRKSIAGWEKAELGDIPTYPYIREFTRYETEYVLKPSDMLGGSMHWDDVSIAGYPLDLQGVSFVKWGIQMGIPDKYGMPLRAFELKNYSNVLTAGKNVGANVVAYGSARIQPNTALAAESIGVILGQIHGNKQLRELNEADMKELHQYLAKTYKIKLTGVKGTNKLTNWSEEEIVQLDEGKIVFASYKPKKK